MPGKVLRVFALLVVPHLYGVVSAAGGEINSVVEVFQRDDAGGVPSEGFQRIEGRCFLGGGAHLRHLHGGVQVLELEGVWPYLDGLVVGASHQLVVGEEDHRPDAAHVALEVTYIFESSHVEHVHRSIVGASYDLAFGQSQGCVNGSRVVLRRGGRTDEKVADLAIFLVPLMGMFARVSAIALALASFMLVTELLPLCRVISSGPAWDNLFSKTLK